MPKKSYKQNKNRRNKKGGKSRRSHRVHRQKGGTCPCSGQQNLFLGGGNTDIPNTASFVAQQSNFQPTDTQSTLSFAKLGTDVPAALPVPPPRGGGKKNHSRRHQKKLQHKNLEGGGILDNVIGSFGSTFGNTFNYSTLVSPNSYVNSDPTVQNVTFYSRTNPNIT